MDNPLEFISAIRDNDFDKTARIYKSDYINMVDEFMGTALHCACTLKEVRIVRFLLNKGWNIEFEDRDKCRPLHVAIIYGRVAIVNVLINGNCLLEERNNFGYTPLDLAKRYCRPECAKILEDAIRRNHLLPSMEGITNGSILGRGRFRSTIKYYDSKLKKYFAMMEISRINDYQLIKLIENNKNIFELKILHPNIVRYYWSHNNEQCLRIIQEYLPGGTIKSLLEQHSPLAEGHIGRYTKQILNGLSFLHDNGIIQREIKCSKILRDIRDNVKINVVWSRRFEGLSAGNMYDFIFELLGVRGPETMPDIMHDKRESYSSDVWSLGVTVVEMLTGHHPYHNLSIFDAISKIKSTMKYEYECPHPISAELQLFLDQALSLNAKNRPSVETLLRSTFIVKYSKETGQEIIPVVPSEDENQDHDTDQDNDTKIPSKLLSYSKGDVIGWGGFGTVYKGYDDKNERYIAIKEVWLGSRDSIGKNAKFLENEVATYKKIPIHDRIVKYYGSCQDREYMNIIMEYMPGGSIKDELKEPFLTPDIVARYSKQILEGLACIHSHGIIHKDIKCANILKDIHGNLKLSDFGLSLECVDKTSSMAALGTFHWMAPEVIRGERFDTSADVWSFGITVIEMLTGDPPYYHTHNHCSFSFYLGNLKKYEYKCPIVIPDQLQSFLDLILQCDKNDRPKVDTLLNSDFISINYR